MGKKIILVSILCFIVNGICYAEGALKASKQGSPTAQQKFDTTNSNKAIYSQIQNTDISQLSPSPGGYTFDVDSKENSSIPLPEMSFNQACYAYIKKCLSDCATKKTCSDERIKKCVGLK